MRCLLLLTLLVSPAVALAQTTTSTSGSGSTAQVGVQASPVQDLTFNSYQSGTLRNVPSIFAPSFAPTTPCSSVISASAGFAGFGLALGGSHKDEECNHRELVRLLHLIGQPDAALALICDDASVRRTSGQLCARAGYVSDKPVDYVSSQPPVMPPASVKLSNGPPPPPAIADGTVGYDAYNKKYVYTGGVWRPEATASQAVGANIDKGSK
jgi:hypothetical protein